MIKKQVPIVGKSFVKVFGMVHALVFVLSVFATGCASKPNETSQKGTGDSTQAAINETKKDPYDFNIPQEDKNMYKISRFLHKIAGDKLEEFAARWTNEYGTAFKKLTTSNPGLIRYSQNYRVIAANSPIESSATGGYDVIDEIWFENKAAADALFSSKEYQETLLPIQAKYIDTKQSVVITGNAHITQKNPIAPKEDKGKVIYQSARKPDLSFEEFKYHWLYIHAPLTRKVPGTENLVMRAEFMPTERVSYTGLQPADFDGEGAIWFNSFKDMQAIFTSDYYIKTLAPDEKKFTDPSRTRVQPVNEVVIFTSSKW